MRTIHKVHMCIHMHTHTHTHTHTHDFMPPDPMEESDVWTEEDFDPYAFLGDGGVAPHTAAAGYKMADPMGISSSEGKRKPQGSNLNQIFPDGGEL